MNCRQLAIIFATSVAATAQAQAPKTVRFFLGYGDPAFAALNGKNLGDELPTSGCVNVLPSTNFSVSVMVQSIAETSLNYGGGNMFLGFDQASTNNSTTGYGNGSSGEAAAWAAGGVADGIKSPLRLSADFANWGSAPGIDSSNSPVTVTISPIVSSRFRGCSRAGSSASLRSIGVNPAISFGTGRRLTLQAGQTVRLADMLIVNSLSLGDCYGDDAAENGLTLNSFNPSSSGSNYLGSMQSGNPGVDLKYSFQAVPEPTTCLAAAAGLAAYARRRRK